MEFEQAGAFSHRTSHHCSSSMPTTYRDFWMEQSCWKTLYAIFSQMILSEKSSQNEVVLIIGDNSEGMGHETHLTVLLLSEGSDSLIWVVLPVWVRSVHLIHTNLCHARNLQTTKSAWGMLKVFSYSHKLSNPSKHRFHGAQFAPKCCN